MKSFNFTYTEDPHIKRRERIIRAYPEIKSLLGPNPYSALLIIILVLLQLFIAWIIKDINILLVLALSYVVGAYIAASLYSLIHDASHNLIFKKTGLNRLIAIIANFPLVIVSAESFRKYHDYHHYNMGNYNLDVGIPTLWEAKWVRNKTSRKIIWLTFFSLFQLNRTKKFTLKIANWHKFIIINIICQVAIDIIIFKLFGLTALIYLGLSVFFAFGFHPLGARVIQEHFMVEEGQETYNFSGASNILECNFGYHNEHHDFPRIPWNRLPKVSKIAPEFYEDLYDHKSRWALIKTFLFDEKWDLYRHTIRTRATN